MCWAPLIFRGENVERFNSYIDSLHSPCFGWILGIRDKSTRQEECEDQVAAGSGARTDYVSWHDLH